MRAQFQAFQSPAETPQIAIQQTLQKFKEEMLEEMNSRLAPYPPLSRNNNDQATDGMQVNEGHYPGYR